ncbi:hypothetical protein FPV67DRAFT_1494951 [Lyophyllum atratum]|nr:hypothetical protein FPV67DRAFT_1494951 [Lyophyllum atratum]
MSSPGQNNANHVLEKSTGSSQSDNATVIDDTDGGSIEFPKSIPSTLPTEESPSRNLVLCFDGTGDQFDADNSNIVEFFTMLKKDDMEEQLVYYQAGIGTYFSPEIATPLAAKISKAMDEAIAWNLSAHVMDGYEFLMQHYQAGDRICIFGFSRGAYTARALAGMIHKVGLLPASNKQQVPFAYKMYEDGTKWGWKQSDLFKKAFSVDVPIEFLGVWDSVNSVGLVAGRRLPFTTSNTIIRKFRHAIALDERRIKFQTNVWNRPDEKEKMKGVKGQKPDVARKKKKKDRMLKKLRKFEKKHSVDTDEPTDVKEVWFTGCHCDVGGGSVKNGVLHSLARIPLRWMVRECFKAKTGIVFTCEGLREIGLDPTSLYDPSVPFDDQEVRDRPPALPIDGMYVQRIPPNPKKLPKPERKKAKQERKKQRIAEQSFSEEEHERLDALSPIYDQLKLSPMWWLLEYLPLTQRYQQDDNTWVTRRRLNRGKPRVIPHQEKNEVLVHRSVKMRMDAQYEDGEKYVPQASFEEARKRGLLRFVD